MGKWDSLYSCIYDSFFIINRIMWNQKEFAGFQTPAPCTDGSAAESIHESSLQQLSVPWMGADYYGPSRYRHAYR